MHLNCIVPNCRYSSRYAVVGCLDFTGSSNMQFRCATVGIEPRAGYHIHRTNGGMTMKFWRRLISGSFRTLSGHSERVTSVAIAPDGKTLVSGSRDKTIKLWDLQTGQELRTLSGHSSEVMSVAIAPDGKTLVSGSKDKLWRLSGR
ncbi:MAG: hypothetical protein GDA43_12985 [Hormoscilla sp. SP5CHS1]|nr:hypothetical protein [Hormoscilla sp. SP12CHS1]MBC6453995.1 hypothetical protein [Hormoscilla sp. SP5CHS1]